MTTLPMRRGPYRRVSGRKPTHNIRGTERRWHAGELVRLDKADLDRFVDEHGRKEWR